MKFAVRMVSCMPGIHVMPWRLEAQKMTKPEGVTDG